MKFPVTITAFALALALTVPAAANTVQMGWNDMATVTGGTVAYSYRPSGALEYAQIQQANITWDTAWEPVFVGATAGDQYFFDGGIRNSWYDGPVPTLTAYDWNGSTGVADGTYEWLVNNYRRDGSGNPVGTPKNSHIRGSDSSLIYDETAGTFEALLPSDGTWYWYTVGVPDSQITSWGAQGVFMSGNFRLTGSFAQSAGNIVVDSAKLQYEVVPEPLTMLGVFAGTAGIAGYIRKRKREA